LLTTIAIWGLNVNPLVDIVYPNEAFAFETKQTANT
jgi:hypothetical protein